MPCEGGPCPMLLPRWARRLVLSHTCWQVKDRGAATNWAEGGSTETVSGPAMSFLAEMFPDFLGWPIHRTYRTNKFNSEHDAPRVETEQSSIPEGGEWLSVRTAPATLAHFVYANFLAWVTADIISSIELHPDWPIILKLTKWASRSSIATARDASKSTFCWCEILIFNLNETFFHCGNEVVASGLPSDSENVVILTAATPTSLRFEEFQSFRLHP